MRNPPTVFTDLARAPPAGFSIFINYLYLSNFKVDIIADLLMKRRNWVNAKDIKQSLRQCVDDSLI